MHGRLQRDGRMTPWLIDADGFWDLDDNGVPVERDDGAEGARVAAPAGHEPAGAAPEVAAQEPARVHPPEPEPAGADPDEPELPEEPEDLEGPENSAAVRQFVREAVQDDLRAGLEAMRREMVNLFAQYAAPGAARGGPAPSATDHEGDTEMRPSEHVAQSEHAAAANRAAGIRYEGHPQASASGSRGEAARQQAARPAARREPRHHHQDDDDEDEDQHALRAAQEASSAQLMRATAWNVVGHGLAVNAQAARDQRRAVERMMMGVVVPRRPAAARQALPRRAGWNVYQGLAEEDDELERRAD